MTYFINCLLLNLNDYANPSILELSMAQ